MALRDLFKRAAGSSVVPPARSTGIEMTPERALTLASIYRAVSIIATTGSQLPLEVYRGSEMLNQPLAARPDANSTAVAFKRETLACMALHGEAFWWVTRKADDTPVNLTVLDPRAVGVTIDLSKGVAGKRVYSYGGRDVRDKNIKHIRLFSLPGRPRGLGPIQAAREDVEAALRLREYGNAIFDTGQTPPGVLSTDQFISQEQADQYRDRWDEVQRERGIAVLGSGMSYQPILLNPEDAQFIANQQWSVTQVARLFGIQTLDLAAGIDGTSLTYANSEDRWKSFLITTLMGYLLPVEQMFSDLFPRGQEARFKVDSLLRADLATRVASYEKLTAIGAMSAEEVRASEGLFPLHGSEGAIPPPHYDGSPT